MMNKHLAVDADPVDAKSRVQKINESRQRAEAEGMGMHCQVAEWHATKPKHRP